MSEVQLAIGEGEQPTIYELVPVAEPEAPRYGVTTGFKKTDRTTDLKDRRLIGQRDGKFDGRCYDTGEYFSPAGDYAKQFLKEAPAGAVLMVFNWDEWAGSRTFGGNMHAKYYSDIESSATTSSSSEI